MWTKASTSFASLNKNPQVSKSQESSPSECNFKKLENLESLNRNRSSFAKKLLQDYRCNLLIKFHSSNQGISPIKNSQKEHLKWFQRMAKRSAVIDGLLTYRDELIEDPNHYRIMVPNDIQLQRHLSRAYHDSPIGMPSHTTFIGQMWLSMWRIGSGVALPVSNLSLLIPNMDQLKFASLKVPSTLLA